MQHFLIFNVYYFSKVIFLKFIKMFNIKNIVMKRLSSVMIAAFVAASSMFMVSCNSDDEEPEIRVKVGTSYVNDGATIDSEVAGTELDVQVTYLSGDAKRIRKVFATGTFSGAEIQYLDTARITGLLGVKEEIRNFKVNVLEGSISFTFKALDTKDTPIGSDVRITIKNKVDATAPAIPAEFASFNVMLGAQSASVGSFYQAVDNAIGTIRTVGQVSGNEGNIDFAYYYGATNKASIVSPDHNWGGNEISWGTVKMSNWSTKNSTKFYKVASANANDPEAWWDDAMDALDGSNATTQANQLATGNVVAFKTQSDVEGAFVVTVNGENAGTASLKIIYLKP